MTAEVLARASATELEIQRTLNDLEQEPGRRWLAEQDAEVGIGLFPSYGYWARTAPSSRVPDIQTDESFRITTLPDLQPYFDAMRQALAEISAAYLEVASLSPIRWVTGIGQSVSWVDETFEWSRESPSGTRTFRYVRHSLEEATVAEVFDVNDIEVPEPDVDALHFGDWQVRTELLEPVFPQLPGFIAVDAPTAGPARRGY